MAAAIDKVVPRQWSQLPPNPTDYYVVDAYQLLSESLTHQHFKQKDEENNSVACASGTSWSAAPDWPIARNCDW